MKLLVVSAREVHELLPYRDCAQLVADGLAALARGEVYQPLRTVIRPPGASGLMALMPCARPGGDAAFSLKAICIMPVLTPLPGWIPTRVRCCCPVRRPGSRWP